MATKATFKVTAVNQTENQVKYGICTISLADAGTVGLFGKNSSPESLSITRTADFAQLKEQFPVGTIVEGYKTRTLIKKPWTNSNGVVIRHRLFLSNDEKEHEHEYHPKRICTSVDLPRWRIRGLTPPARHCVVHFEHVALQPGVNSKSVDATGVSAGFAARLPDWNFPGLQRTFLHSRISNAANRNSI